MRDAERDALESENSSPSTAPRPSRPSMIDSIESSIAAMKWIQPSDGALVDLARLYAGQIDAILDGDPSATGKAASIGQLLTRILHELGGTPTVRLQHELRSLRLLANTNSGDDDGDSSGGEASSNSQTDERAGGTVTPIRRPPKRNKRA